MKILKFYADWCQPCKTMIPIFLRIKEELKVEVIDVNVEDNNDMCVDYNIKGVPTLIILDDDEKEVNRYVGSTTYERIKELIEAT